MINDEKIKDIKLVVLDVDGTLTDGKVTITNKFDELKSFNVKDGMAIAQSIKHGLNFAIITGRRSEIVDARMKELGITEIHQKISNKIECLTNIVEKYKLNFDNVAYVGDDINDIPAILKSGFTAAPKDSSDEVLKLVDFVSSKDGGDGAVREVLEIILKSQGKWKDILDSYYNKK